MMTSTSTQALQCPACGGPIKPDGRQAVIRCPYCQGSVIVPESLRQIPDHVRWPVVLFDSFQSNNHGWLEGTTTSELFTPLTQRIHDGRYRWEAHTARPTSMSTAWISAYRVGDFELHATAKHLVGSKTGSSWGVIFRTHDNENYYWYRITNNQLFAFSVVEQKHWHTFVEWTRASAIKPYGVNQLSVLATGAHFVLSINGHVVCEIDDQRFEKGMVGLAIEGYTTGERVVVDFLDLTLRAP